MNDYICLECEGMFSGGNQFGNHLKLCYDNYLKKAEKVIGYGYSINVKTNKSLECPFCPEALDAANFQEHFISCRKIYYPQLDDINLNDRKEDKHRYISCKYCRTEYKEDNEKMHYIKCKSKNDKLNQILCSICNFYVHNLDYEDHILECSAKDEHNIVKCEGCLEPFTSKLLSDHQKVCEFVHKIDIDQISNDIDKLLGYMKCSKCDKKVDLKDKDSHELVCVGSSVYINNNYENIDAKDRIKCATCEKSFKKEEIDEHELTCSYEKV